MKSFSLIAILCIYCSVASAQNRNSVQLSLSYPWITNGRSNFAYFNLYQFNAGYNYSLSKHFAIGGNYGVSAHGYTGFYTDTVTISWRATEYLHNFDGGFRWMVNPNAAYRLSVDLSTGLTILNEREKSKDFSGSIETHAGYNVNPSLQLNRTLCNGFDIFLRGGYCLTVLYKQPVHSISAGLGTSYSF